jgi:eukaryotic-like serine/threonine-protein kinase
MTAERWQQVERIYRDAAARRPSERCAFLEKACAGDRELRDEVERMLSGEAGISGFLEARAVDVAARELARERISSGSRIGPYEIVSLLGAGGMGEVYKARDTRLNRAVAIKVLPAYAAGDAERRKRLLREARTASALNHPNIVTIHDVVSEGGHDSIVMEYVEGRTLQQVIGRKGLLVSQVLEYGIQIAAALAAAHAAGIIHRDLKPANVIVTKGNVKVLDFGLAKFLRTSPAPFQSAETLTAEHVIVGTLAYMAPEQLAGAECDARTDIFALGLILYEMIGGKPAFSAPTREDLMAEVLRCQPTRLENTPASLACVLDRCLARDPADRWQAAADLRASLELAVIPPGQPSSRRSSARRALWIALLIAAVATLLYWPRHGPALREPVAFAFNAPEGTMLEARSGIPSPDGRLLAFVARDPLGKSAIWLRSLASQTGQRLPDTDEASGPFWSPDGQSLGFFAGGKLKRISVSGGPARTICNASVDLGATWNSRGDIVFSPANRVPLHRVPASGGTPQVITALNTARGENSHRWPQFLPDSRHFLFTARSSVRENTGIYVGSLDSKNTRFLVSAQSGAAYAPPGYLLFGREGILMAQRFDERKLSLEGEAFPVFGEIQHATPSAIFLFAVSLDGSVLAWQPLDQSTNQLAWFDRSGRNLGSVGPPGDYVQPRLSPDARRIAVVMADKESGNRDIWLMDAASGRATRFTFNVANDWYPIWSPDGASVIFASDRVVPSAVYRRPVNGSGEEELVLTRPEGGLFPEDWSKDGHRLLAHLNAGSIDRMLVLAVSEMRTARSSAPSSTVGDAPAAWSNARFSPGGQWIAYASNEGGTLEVYVRPTAGGEAVRISTAGGAFPTWGKAGKELYYVSPERVLMSAEITSEETFDVAAPKALFRVCSVAHTTRGAEYFYDPSPDGRRFLLACESPGTKQRSINVMTEWQRTIAGMPKQ